MKPKLIYVETSNLKCYMFLEQDVNYDDISSIATIHFNGRVDASLFSAPSIGVASLDKQGLSQVLTPISRTVGMLPGSTGILRIPYCECLQFMEIDPGSAVYRDVMSCM
jgi:hypothetical protein